MVRYGIIIRVGNFGGFSFDGCNIDRQIAKFNSLPNFLAIWYSLCTFLVMNFIGCTPKNWALAPIISKTISTLRAQHIWFSHICITLIIELASSSVCYTCRFICMYLVIKSAFWLPPLLERQPGPGLWFYKKLLCSKPSSSLWYLQVAACESSRLCFNAGQLVGGEDPRYRCACMQLHVHVHVHAHVYVHVYTSDANIIILLS